MRAAYAYEQFSQWSDHPREDSPANVHCATATENFIALEHHSVDISWWEDLAICEKPIFRKGFAVASEKPGLGIELNEEVVKTHLKPGTEYFAPTPEWDQERSWDRQWS